MPWFDQLLYEEIFYAIDQDDDQKITKEQLHKFSVDFPNTGSQNHIFRCFQETKKKHSEQMTFVEYMLAMGFEPPFKYRKQKKEKKKEEKKTEAKTDNESLRLTLLREIFKMFDKNGDHMIDRVELAAVFKELGKHMTPAEVDGIMAKADQDGSGALNYEEFIKSME